MNKTIRKAFLYLRVFFIKPLYYILQSDENDCGAAAFATIAGHYGYRMNIEQAKDLVSLNALGDSVWDLAEAAESIGIEGRPAHAIYSAIQQISWPFIAHYGGELPHFVVVFEAHDDYVILVDPGKGVEIQTVAEFQKRWSGYIVEFKPTKNFVKKNLRISSSTLFFGLIRENVKTMVALLIFSVVFSFLGMLSSYFVKVILDKILPEKNINQLSVLGWLFIMFYGLNLILSFINAGMSISLSNRIYIKKLMAYLEKVIFLPQKFYEIYSIGNLSNRIGDIQKIQYAVGDSLVLLVSDGIFMSIAIVVMAMNNLPLTLLVLSFMPAFLLLVVGFQVPMTNLLNIQIEKSAAVFSRFIDAINGISEIKMSSTQEYFAQSIKEKAKEYVQNNANLARFSAVSSQTMSFLTSLLTVFILWKGTILIFGNTLSIGSMMFFFGLAAYVISPIQRIPQIYFTMQEALIALERFYGIMDISIEKNIFTGTKELTVYPLNVEFQNVNFVYRKDAVVLKDINIFVNPGQMVAVVGKTGAGKTTLAKLLCGFYKATSGSILVGGVSIDDVSLDSLRKNVGMVFQRSHLFSGNLYRNVVMGQDIPMEEIKKRFQDNEAFKFIYELPQDFSTQVYSGGSNFSAGQIQRISIMRTLVKDPALLIFDEATSNLDSETEKFVLQFLKEQRREKTTIIIGHRLSTVAMADCIIVLDEGRIVEQGTLKELLRNQGTFYQLFYTQLIAGQEQNEI